MYLQVKFDSESLSVESQPHAEPSSRTLLWRDISLVIAYKKDCFTIDQIRLEIYPQDGGGLLITEDYEGFAEFVEALPMHLTEVPKDWNLKLVHAPAFDPTVHVLLKR